MLFCLASSIFTKSQKVTVKFISFWNHHPRYPGTVLYYYLYFTYFKNRRRPSRCHPLVVFITSTGLYYLHVPNQKIVLFVCKWLFAYSFSPLFIWILYILSCQTCNTNRQSSHCGGNKAWRNFHEKHPKWINRALTVASLNVRGLRDNVKRRDI